MDGKGLKNTLTDAFEATQNFVNVVSVFQLGQGLAVGQTAFENGQQSEIQAVYELLERLQLTGVTVSLDALHAQKTVELIHKGRQAEPYFERQYFITSGTKKADALQARIRSHWGIENSLHWVKDVVLAEDHSSIAAKSAASLNGDHSQSGDYLISSSGTSLPYRCN